MSVIQTMKSYVLEYPKQFIELLKNRTEILECIELNKSEKKKCDKEWYFSHDGRWEYEKLSSIVQKTHFFMNYLVVVAKNSERKDVLYKIAFIMAKSMVNSNLVFSGYPNILDEKKNPLVRYIMSEEVPESCCEIILGVLHGRSKSEINTYKNANKLHSLITYCKGNEPLTDIYKIERDIISVFRTNEEKNLFGPYQYRMFLNSNK